MNLAIPRENDSEFILYLWKIIDLPKISRESLKYQLSFEFFLDSPSKSSEIINRGIQQGILIEDEENYISLSQEMEKKLLDWQKSKKADIKNKISSYKNSLRQVQAVKSPKKSSFNVLLKAFLDAGTFGKVASIYNKHVNITENNPKEGLLTATITGSKENPYYLNYNRKEKTLTHNCQDFISRRAPNKKFCKHIIKVFLMLKDEDEDSATSYLENLAEDIDNWGFSE